MGSSIRELAISGELQRPFRLHVDQIQNLCQGHIVPSPFHPNAYNRSIFTLDFEMLIIWLINKVIRYI